MSNPSFPFWADPSDPGVGKDQDPVVAAEQGHGTDSINVLGTEVGEASDDDPQIIEAADVDETPGDSPAATDAEAPSDS